MSQTSSPRFVSIGARIRAARQRVGLSQEAFAARIGTSRRHVMRLERGDHRPAAPMLARISEVTETTERELLGSDDEEADPVAALMRALEKYVDYRLGSRSFA